MTEAWTSGALPLAILSLGMSAAAIASMKFAIEDRYWARIWISGYILAISLGLALGGARAIL